MERKMRKELYIGLFIVAVYLVLNRFASAVIPYFVLGILCGVGLCFELIGVLPDKTYEALKRWKRSFVRQV